jgi:hypothetical protein
MSERKKRAASTNAGKKNKLSALEQMAKARESGGRNAKFEVRYDSRMVPLNPMSLTCTLFIKVFPMLTI